jgi:hypothetical protein
MSPMFNYQIQYERLRETLEELWDISTDSSITEENKVKIIRDVSRATLDDEPTTADLLRDPTLADKDNNRFNDKEWSIKDEYNEEEVAANVPPISVDIDYLKEDEDIAIGASIVKSNREVSGVFMVDGEIKDVDYFEEGEELE